MAQLLVDGSDTTLGGAVRQLARFPFIPGGSVSNKDVVDQISVRLLYNPERRAALFTVPGLLGVILTMTMIMFTSIAIVRERERGNMELLITTPVRNLELMIGKITPYVGIGLVQVSVILLLFLMKWRTTLVTLTALPLSLAAGLLVLDALTGDEVVLRLGPSGGTVHGYGLAAPQLDRLRALRCWMITNRNVAAWIENV